MKEPINNIGFLHPQDTKPTGNYKDVNPESLVGKYVQVRFPVKTHDTKEDRIEYMWVYVESTSCQDDEVLGTLDNDPIYECEYKYGSFLSIYLKDIVAIYEE